MSPENSRNTAPVEPAAEAVVDTSQDINGNRFYAFRHRLAVVGSVAVGMLGTASPALAAAETLSHDQSTGLVPALTAQQSPTQAGNDAKEAAASATSLTSKHKVKYYSNPLKNSRGGPLVCPDPNAIRVSPHNYYLFCTPNNSEKNPPGEKAAAIPEYHSRDTIHWSFVKYVFSEGHEPGWMVPTNGTWTGGRVWAPEIDKVDGAYDLYFAAEAKQSVRLTNTAGKRVYVPPGTMLLGVARSKSITGNNWKTRVIHFRGEDNSVPGGPKEIFGGDIDPGEVQITPSQTQFAAQEEGLGKVASAHTLTKPLNLLFWTEQPGLTWEGVLNKDGTRLTTHIRPVYGATSSMPWECANGKHCVVEGTEPYVHNGVLFSQFSGGSTWGNRGDQYAVGIAAEPANVATTGQFVVRPKPILRHGNGFVDPGGESKPFEAPNGEEVELVHEQPYPNSMEEGRYLAEVPVHFTAGGSIEYYMKGNPTKAPRNSKRSAEIAKIKVEWPLLGEKGRLKRYGVVPMLKIVASNVIKLEQIAPAQ